MLVKKYMYPLDITGTAVTNKVPAEPAVLSPANGPGFNFFIPKAAPYFYSTAKLIHAATGDELRRGIDWEPSYKFLAASNDANSDVFAAVTVLNTTYTGTFRLTYQSLGGDYTYDEQSLLEILAAAQIDPRITSWESVIDDPSLFNSGSHLHHASTSMGYDDLVFEIRELVAKFSLEASSLKQLLLSHMDNKLNPHDTDLVKLGIERFENVMLSSVVETIEGINNINYTSPAGVRAALANLLQWITDNHFAARNPHGTNAEDVGLGLVRNMGLATAAQIQAAAAEGYMTPALVAGMISGVVGQLPTQLITQLQMLLTTHMEDQDNPHNTNSGHLGIPLANLQVGLAGDVAFYKGSSEPFDTTFGQIQRSIAIVTTAAELTAQQAARESFADVFNNWQRVAILNGNPNAVPAELTGWSYNSGTDTISSTINSSSYTGLISPEKIVGDYTIEVELRSTSTDDDFIGVVLNMIPVENGYAVLIAYRRAGSEVGGGNVTLQISTPTTTRTITLDNTLLVSANGWAGYNALGATLLKVVRTGSVLTVSTGNPGGGYTSVKTFDLTSDLDTAIFTGPATLGYSTYSQTAASFKSIARSGANPIIAATHSNQVFTWNGSAYVVSATPLSSVLLPGRYYRNPTTKRKYFSATPGTAFLVDGTAAPLDYSLTSRVNNTAAYINENGTLVNGWEIDFNYQHPTTGVMTNLGKMKRLIDGSGWELRSKGIVPKHSLLLGPETGAMLGGISADNTNKVGLINGAGSFLMYVDSSNSRMFHYGATTLSLSDPQVKNLMPTPESYVTNPNAIAELKIQHWTWKEDDRLPESLQRQYDFGLLTTDVAKYCSALVQYMDSGLATYDVGKLAVMLSLDAHSRLNALDRVAQLSDAQWERLLKLLEE